MEGKVRPRPRLGWMAGLACTMGATLAAGAGGAFAATHYPPGAVCYDCHAISKSKMVAGTHLLKKSDRTVALEISETNPQAPCLFCHDRNAAASAVDRDRMKGVGDHFDGTSASKHRAAIQSGFGDQTLLFDCRDCHQSISLGVVSDGSGNARVHGVDASGSTRVNVAATLVGWLASGYNLSEHTCRNAACHGGPAPNSYGNYAARPAHGMGTTTLAGGATPTACTQCHGTHNSYQNTSLITLRTDGTTSNNPAAPLATRVTPEKCGICHAQDDGPGGGAYALKGHGQSSIASGSLGCTACHAENVAHSFSKDALGTNPLRFKFAENTSAQSAIRQQPPYDQVYSICLTCHAPFGGKAHGGTTAKAGCNDCHEPHGTGVGSNAAMIRERIPKVDPAGTPVYGDGSASAPYETNSYLASGDASYKTDGTGLCDNRECHQGRVVAGDPIYPLAAFLTGGAHSGGDIATGADFVCQSCHSHTDDGGSWGAKASCTLCHGQPPVSTATTAEGYTRFSEAASPHRRHAAPRDQGGYGYRCTTCHLGYTSAATHDTTPKTYTDVLFDPAANPSGAVYTPATATCANLYCHSDGQSAASVGSVPVQWMSGFSAPNWSAQNLPCNACHGGVAGATRIATASHAAHLTWANITCFSCHADTVAAVDTDTTTALPSGGIAAHTNGVKNLKAAGTFGGQAVSFVPGAGSCAQISCHAGNGATWGAELACADCHLRPVAQGGDRDNYLFGDGLVASAAAEEWEAAGHGRPGAAGSYPSSNPAAAFSGPASDPQGCAYCHAFLGTAQNSAVAHGEAENPFRLANRSGTGADGGWNNACLVCHLAGSSGYDPDGVSSGYSARNATKKADRSHGTGGHAGPTFGGIFCWDCHDPHGDVHPYMIHSGDGSAPGRGVTDVSDGVYGIPVSSRPVTGLDVAGGYTSGDLANSSRTGLCQTCHAASGGARSYNRSTFTPLASHNGADAIRCTACHQHDRGFVTDCTQCHAGGHPSAPQVVWPAGNASGRTTAYGSHLRAQRGEGFSASTDWRTQCNRCHTGHAGPVAVPLPPASWADPSGRLTGTDMQARLGIGYAATGGIHLGGTATSGASEAELCWSCHDAQSPPVSEWGYNTKTTPVGYPVVQLTTASDGTAQTFNFGWLYTSAAYTTKTSDWTTGYWMDQYDPQLRRRIASIHTASFDPAGQSSSVAANVDALGTVNRTSPTLEARSHIRCSYCHDVHDVNRAPGDTATGKPHLRGTWIGNPYPPDVPPRARGTHPWMEGPRVIHDNNFSRSKGGYFIDLNSGNPTTTTTQTAMNTLEKTAGLCVLCHGSDVNGMDFYTGSSLWRPDTVNGHSNSTLGGTRANARNLFDGGPSDRNVPHGMTAQLGLGSSWNDDGSFFWYYGDSGCDCPPAWSGWYPQEDRNNWYNPGGIGGAWGTGTMAHKFTCSKCHTPHASGLPALLTTNCIDVRLPNPAGGWGHGLYPESSNCHRKSSVADGWHRLAPAQ